MYIQVQVVMHAGDEKQNPFFLALYHLNQIPCVMFEFKLLIYHK